MERVVSVNIIGNIDKYNKRSSYYNSICYIADSDYGTDITLHDRREEYINNNMGICKDGCDIASYNYETQKAVCSCGIKTEIPLMKDIKIDKQSLLKSFTDINNIANIQMLKCYKIVFTKKNILKNIGCFIFLFFILINFICLFSFILKDYKLLYLKICKLKMYFLNNKIKNKKIISYNNERNKKANFRENKNGKKSSEKNLVINNAYKKKQINSKMKLNKLNSPPKNNFNNIPKSNKKSIYIIKNKFIINLNKNQNTKKMKNSNILSKNINIKKSKVMELNYNEINHLTFNEAITKDKRTYCQYYLSLLKSNHFIHYICYNRDYNSIAIKVSILILNLASSIAINSLFFNDSTMHKIYIDHGSFDFLYQLPQIIYSSIISYILDFLINFLGLSQDNILTIKSADILAKDIYKKFNKLFKVLKVKFTFFFIINFILLILFWYYVTCFCGIYRNTQIHLFKDSLSSFVTSFITPFVLYLFPGLFRICALKGKNKGLYKFSKILQTI